MVDNDIHDPQLQEDLQMPQIPFPWFPDQKHQHWEGGLGQAGPLPLWGRAPHNSTSAHHTHHIAHHTLTSVGLCSASKALFAWMCHDKMAATFSCSVRSLVTRMKWDKTKFEQTYTLRLSLVGAGHDCRRRRLTCEVEGE